MALNNKAMQRFRPIFFLRFFTVAALCLFQIHSFAQINEDFTNPDLTSNPVWSGNLNDFEINAFHQLHLKTTGADTSYLSTPLSCSTSMEWKFWVHLSFSPSENNNARIYLIADNPIPTQSDKAFYIQLGEARSLDAITLFYKNGSSIREVCRGTSGSIANPFSFRIRVVRLNNGTWRIAADPTGANLYANETSGIENAPLPDGFFSLFCRYTTSNSAGFYFDDIQIHSYPVDNTPPLLLQASVSADNQVQLNFNKPVEKSASMLCSNYRLSDGSQPIDVEGDPQTGTIIYLKFNKPLPVDQSFSLIYSGITDLDGNSTSQKEINLVYHFTHAFDVLISEIMANPVPSQGLPDCEYLELYNRSSYSINLKNWYLQTSGSEQVLPDTIIAPQQYLIVAAASNLNLLNKYGKIMGLKNLTLPNDGCVIALKDQRRQVIHALDFKPVWHDNASKKSGGWSLEMIDPMNPCGESANYRSSIDAKGGTPGSVNSVNALLPDHHFPELLTVFPTDSLHLRLDYSETLDTLQMSNPAAYNMEPSIGQPKSVFATGPLYRSVLLELTHPLLKKTVYTLTVNNSMNDCAGNPLRLPLNIQFGLPLPLKNNCIVINEIMFDPGAGKEEFIEIYNRSAEMYDLSRLYLNVENNGSAIRKSFVQVCEQGQLFSPGGYMVLTGNKKSLLKQYPLISPGMIIEVPGFQSLSNDGGVITLSDSTGLQIDKAGFNPSMHFQMLRLTAGVSLERIDPDKPSEAKDNWQSAAETAGFSTPGKINSQHISQNPLPFSFILEPEQFTPDNDGKDDELIIHYKPEKPGSMMTLTIFDIKGRLIRRLVSNVLLASENTFSWDGFKDDHTKAPAGIYIVYAEVYNAAGDVHHFKKSTILATPLKRS
jgi:hypothetical protein